MFLHMSVILFTGGEVCRIACWDTPPPRPEAGTPQTRDSTPPKDQTPQDQTPQTTGRHPQDQRKAPPGPDPPGLDTTPSAPPPRPSAVHAGRYGQQACGTHPTGIQSCFLLFPSLSLSVSRFRACVNDP